MFWPSRALMTVWQVVGSSLKGPTLNSEAGTVRLKGFPAVSVNVKVMSAAVEFISEQGKPYAPSDPWGVIFGDIKL